MSATLNAELFSNYFGGAPTFHIPVRQSSSFQLGTYLFWQLNFNYSECLDAYMTISVIVCQFKLFCAGGIVVGGKVG